jgi:group I intron endonuclease
MVGFVYLWRNKINGKKYIGSHIGSIDDGYIGSGKIFNRALKKYGVENFERTILEHVEDRSMISDREQYYLDLYDAANSKEFYNLRSKVGGGWEYVNSNPKFADKMRKTNQGLWSRHPHPKGMLGKQHTDTAWSKTRDGWKKWANENLKKPVLQFDLDMNLLCEHESIAAAAKSVNGSPSNIKYTIEGTFAKAYGFKWQYKE